MTKARWHQVLFVGASIVVVVAPEPACAQGLTAEPGQNESDVLATDPSETAAATFWQGKRLYDSGEFAQALRRFEEAYVATKDPVLLYDIAQCQRQLGECYAAKRAYQEFKLRASESSLTENALMRLAELELICPEVPSAGPAMTRSTQGAEATAAAHAEPAVRVQVGAERQHLPAERRATGHQYWQLSLAVLVAGVATGAAAAGTATWNHGRYATWGSRNAGLEKGAAAGESDVNWSIRQRENDELGNSIESARRVTVALGVVSGAALIASAVSYFAFNGSNSTATTARPNDRVLPNIAPGNYQVLVSGSF